MTDPASTMKERMLAGELYLGSDPELIREKSSGAQLVGQYNATSASDQRSADQTFGAP
jgi:Maltose acetyltransferase